MLTEALLVALTVTVLYFINLWFGYIFTDKPIIIGTFVGLVLGDLQTGIICGGAYELIFLGAVNIGGAVPSDPTTGTAVATAFTILSGMTTETAMALAIPVGLLIAQVQMLLNTVPSFLNPVVDRMIESDNDKGIAWMTFLTAFIKTIPMGIFCFFAIYFGSGSITDMVNSLPEFVTGGLSVASGMLAAVGFGMLLRIIWSKALAVYFFVGFVLATYMNVPIIGIAIIGLIYCIIRYFDTFKKESLIQAEGDEFSEEEMFND